MDPSPQGVQDDRGQVEPCPYITRYTDKIYVFQL